MMEEETFSPEESLLVIQSMIDNARERFQTDGHLYLVWGWTILFCSIGQYVLAVLFQYPQHYLVWEITWLVLIYQVFYVRRKKKKSRVKTYTAHILAFVWITFVVLMFLIGFLFGRIVGPEYYRNISPVLLALYGMPTFLSGIIIRFRPLRIGGILCWILCIVSAFFQGYGQLLFLATGVLGAWIIPGYLLRSRYRKQNSDYEAGRHYKNRIDA